MLHIILTDLGASAQFNTATVDKPVEASPKEVDLTYNEDEDVYGDYNDDGLEELEDDKPANTKEVDVNDSTGVIDLLIKAFAAK